MGERRGEKRVGERRGPGGGGWGWAVGEERGGKLRREERGLWRLRWRGGEVILPSNHRAVEYDWRPPDVIHNEEGRLRENGYDESANLIQNTKAGGSSSFTAAAG
ncbi:hypothetical protein Tco_0462115 [Tanacetum coccineum]